MDIDTFKYIHEYIQVSSENLYLVVRGLSWNLVLFSFEAPHTSSRKPPPPRASLQTLHPTSYFVTSEFYGPGYPLVTPRAWLSLPLVLEPLLQCSLLLSPGGAQLPVAGWGEP